MNVLIFGVTGMVGQGVLRECLNDQDVQRVQTIGRTGTEFFRRPSSARQGKEENLTWFRMADRTQPARWDMCLR